MRFILGTKRGMTQVFREDGTVVPVTRVQAGPCVVTQVMSDDSRHAVQVGFGEQKVFRLNKAQQGHLKGLSSVRHIREFALDAAPSLKRGDTFSAAVFQPGDSVKVTGRSKGKGFQGVVKRHGFAGSPASHGHKDQLRMPGSIGATDAARVFKGTRMGGQMGNTQVTVANLEIVEVDADNNELLIKGAVPGARGGLLQIVAAEGEMEAQTTETATKEEKSDEQDVNENKESASTEAPADEGSEVAADTPAEEDKKTA